MVGPSLCLSMFIYHRHPIKTGSTPHLCLALCEKGRKQVNQSPINEG